MVYVLLANGFEEVEAITPVDILRRCGIDCETVSITSSRTVTGAHKIEVAADITITEMSENDIEMIILPGGMPGTVNLEENADVQALLNIALVRNAYIAAICAAPSILGKKMMLSGKKATCFPGFEKYLYGAEVSGDKVCVDGKIITAKGAGAAAEFGKTLAAFFVGDERAREVYESMQY